MVDMVDIAPILKPKHQRAFEEFFDDFCDVCDTKLEGTFCGNCDALLIHPWWKRLINRILMW